MKKKQKHKNKIVKKIALKIIKPFIPFIVIILIIMLAICTVIDAVLVDEVQADDSSMSDEEKEVKNNCKNKADSLNKIHNYIGNELTNNWLDSDNRENDKAVQWSQIYAIMAFQNMANKREMNDDLLNEVSSEFESTFRYEKSDITTETTTVDEEGNEVKNTTTETVYHLVESDTIMGHYKYNYQEQVTEDGNAKTTKTVFQNEELVGEKYERLRKYLKDNFNISDDSMDMSIQMIIQASNGYYNKRESTSWLSGDSYEDTSPIITNGEGLVPTGMFTWPIPGYTTITSPYGMRVHPITGAYKLHSGTDISAPVRS